MDVVSPVAELVGPLAELAGPSAGLSKHKQTCLLSCQRSTLPKRIRRPTTACPKHPDFWSHLLHR